MFHIHTLLQCLCRMAHQLDIRTFWKERWLIQWEWECPLLQLALVTYEHDNKVNAGYTIWIIHRMENIKGRESQLSIPQYSYKLQTTTSIHKGTCCSCQRVNCIGSHWETPTRFWGLSCSNYRTDSIRNDSHEHFGLVYSWTVQCQKVNWWNGGILTSWWSTLMPSKLFIVK